MGLEDIKKQLKTKDLVVYMKDVSGPFFTLWKWTRENYNEYIEFNVDAVKILFRFRLHSFEVDSDKKLPDRQMLYNADIFIFIKKPHKDLIDGLSNKTHENELNAANEIYSIYKKAINILTLQSLWYLKLPSVILSPHLTNFDELFYEDSFSSKDILWKINNKEFKKFKISKKPKRKIPDRFLSRNLLSIKKWKKLKKYLVSASELSRNIAELVRIRSKIEWNEKRIPTIEISALMEVVIRNGITMALQKQGVSKRKIRDISDEAGMSILLNMVLPFILSKKELIKYKTHLNNLDTLRKVRNRIMHDNLDEDSIDIDIVKKGVDSAIAITLLLEKKV